MTHPTRIFKRYEANPIIDVKDYPQYSSVFNPAPAQVGDETILLVSVVEQKPADGELGRDAGQTRVARSRDGLHFTLSDDNFIQVQSDAPPYTYFRHFIDNRVTPIDGVHYIITPVMMRGFDCPVGMLGKTKDFRSYERIAVITQPRNRGASLFPEKINGLYYKLDRPGGGPDGPGEIWISSSPDLLHWGNFQPVLAANYRFWNMLKIGPTPPIRTDAGWLDIIHGVFRPAGGAAYYVGAMLLDLDEPWRVIGKTSSPLLGPDEDYERHGRCDNVVFPCGVLVDHQRDLLKLYYGAADTSICYAEGALSEVVDACLKEL